MYQLEVYTKGELDYALISGPTGPLVYVGSALFPSHTHPPELSRRTPLHPRTLVQDYRCGYES